MNMIMLGPPGSGKGTQSVILAERLGLRTISTGAIFRKNIAEGTELGRLAKSYIDEGKLVPDEVTVGLLKDSVKGLDGIILDGFPRTVAQAEALADFLDIDCVLYLDVDYDEVVNRLSGRRECAVCGSPTHVSMGNKVCQKCGGELIQRADDKEEVIRKRFVEYEKATKPLVDYYEKKGKLITLLARGSVEEITEKILGELKR